MDLSTQIQRLTYLHDLKIMGVSVSVPENFPKCKIFDSTLKKYPQSFSFRCAQVSLYLAYKEHIKNTPISYPEFEAKILTTRPGQEEFQKMLQKVSTTLPQTITPKDLTDLLQA